MVYDSLTEAPHNLKEGIDWLVALKGTDAERNLKAMSAALHKFLADKPVGKMEVPALEDIKKSTKEFIGQQSVKDLWPASELLGRFSKRMNKSIHFKFFGTVDESDYKNVVKSRGLKPEDIAANLAKAVDGCEKFLEKIKSADQYKSAYSSEATWEASCAKDPEACAVVLVGIAPMLYTGLRSLRFASHASRFNWVPFSKKINLGSVLEALGYKGAERRANMSGSYVFEALENVKLKMLITLYDLSGFWAFY
ncbi:hypothetical protein, conserved [Babesia ovata]|uniref:Uncharacterized protein n=1 Tax=Babesia ovata TaxID=189622 RepID=A0A2H6K6N2_9APIC|nr:uncharacterized protein BOVATA_001310 [Babesia ovata]GBE58638.1 hypothetical protein, conserved [Babesia ovata]